jgi:hypothetical protein
MLCEIVLTVSESKRLIAKGVAAMPAVRDALADGVVAVATGSTNAYIVEELTGKPIEKNAYMTGATLPAGIGRKGLLSRKVPDVVFRKGEPVEGAQATEIVGEMGPGDVFIKGANAVHYQTGKAGILIGHPTGGTIGATIGTIVSRRIALVVPVGLEKCVAEPIEDVQTFMGGDKGCEGSVTSIWPIDAQIITEIEALKLLTGADAMQSVAGGLAGAEGAVRLVARGTAEEIGRVTELADAVHGEPPFVRT